MFILFSDKWFPGVYTLLFSNPKTDSKVINFMFHFVFNLHLSVALSGSIETLYIGFLFLSV